ncbi:MAG: ABC transporter substrate-binding protein [Deltaproteobacteria bacterium]|nr:ABC transporter substrate-binding protein [Deltaproteobacteria bacterium]
MRRQVFPLLLLSSQACSLQVPEPAACATNLECRDAFGQGSVCGEAGLCETAAVPERCVASFPDALTLPLNPATTHLIATQFDHQLESHVARFRAVELAVSQANDNAGLEGVNFAVLHCSNEEDFNGDGLTKDEAAVELGVWLADSLGVSATVGPASSGRVEAVYEATKGAGMLTISPSATSPALTALDGLSATDNDPGLLWRTAPPDSLQGAVMAADLLERGVRTASVIYEVGAYGEGLDEVFTTAFEAGGGEATSYPYTGEDFGGATADALTSGPEEVLFISSDVADLTGFLDAAGVLSGYASLGLFLPDTARTSDLLNNVNEDAQALFPNVRGTGPSVPAGTVYDAFKASYVAAWQDDASAYSYTAHAYDAAWMLIYGFAWAEYQEDGLASGLTLARGLRKLSAPGVTAEDQVPVRPSSWNEVKASFSDGAAVNLLGASGQLDYDPVTEETTGPIDVWVIEGGEFVVEEVVEP